MPNSRRKFLKAGVLAALFTAVPLKTALGQSWKDRDGNPGNSPETQNDPLANYTKATFLSYLNSVFELHTTTGVVEVTLLRVDDMAAPKGGECFTLLFRGGSRAQRHRVERRKACLRGNPDSALEISTGSREIGLE